MENLVYRDLIEQYKKLNDNEVRSLLIYKSQLFNLINSVSSIENFLDLDNEFIVKLLDKDILLQCENFGKVVNEPENMFVKISTFRGIDFSDPISLVATAKKVYMDLEGAMSKIMLSDDLILYRVVFLKKEDKLDDLARGNLVSSSINLDEAMKFVDNKSNRILIYEINLKKGTSVLVTPYSLGNKYESAIEMYLKPDNYTLIIQKDIDQGQREVLFSKSNLNLEIIEEKCSEIDGALVTYYKVNTNVKNNNKLK